MSMHRLNHQFFVPIVAILMRIAYGQATPIQFPFSFSRIS